ncbi:MAG: regulatory protein RecX [Bdellovibrionales bacterium]|nr:regulatory protein RecX [Bdellovibrionales bacterium]
MTTRTRNKKIDSSDNLALAVAKLAQLLSQRDHSEKELKQKLAVHFQIETIEKAIERAKSNRWLAKENELAEKVAQNLGRKKKGQLYIQNYLRRKGLPQVVFDKDQEVTNARNLLVRKFGSEIDFETKQRAYRFLAHRGFEDYIIREVLYEKS